MSKPRSHQLDIYGAWIHCANDEKAWLRLQRLIDSLELPDDGVLGCTSRDIGDDGSVNLSVFIDLERLAGNSTGLVEIITHEATHAAGCCSTTSARSTTAWAIFERAADPSTSRALKAIGHHALAPESPEFQEA